MNPNGDPIDENKPRIDEETGINIITDVRIKRTIRDYLSEYKNKEIFVKGVKDDDGIVKAREDRLGDFHSNREELLNKCIDIRLFGATIAIPNSNKKKNSANKTNLAASVDSDEKADENTINNENSKNITLTGPVQFKYGRSLHAVDLTYIKGTTVFPSKQNMQQGTFTEKYMLPYSLINVYGVVNENAALNQKINLTKDDINLLLEALWNGTKNLITTSKFGQVPRLLVQLEYKENSNFYIGELDKRIKLVKVDSGMEDKQIRNISDVKIDITDLIDSIKKYKGRINSISIKIGDRIDFIYDGKTADFKELINEFNPKYLEF
jgi:CRISPR-associated protein Csh2